jgi:hypothetical protein
MFKLIAFEIAKTDIEYYAEAQWLLEAYLLLRQYQVPLTRLNEFGAAPAKKLQSFIEKFEAFLSKHALAVPALNKFKQVSLSKTPFALFFLALMRLKAESNLEHVSSVFTSVFIPEDLARRHYVDSALRSRLHAYVNLKAYVEELRDFPTWQAFAEIAIPKTASLSEWVVLTRNILTLFAISMPRHFLEQLEAYFLPAAPYVSPCTYTEFIEHLQLFLQDTALDINLNAAYERYRADHITVALEPVRANPFIPMALQKEYKMFAAPIEVEEEQAISIPRASGQKKYSITSSDTLQHPEKLKLREQVGGAALLNEQSACPFKAFAHFQLGLRPMVQQDAWLNQKLKGIAIHRILEKIWQELKSQSALLSLSDPDLKALVHKVIFDVITNLSRGQQFFLPDTLAQLEIQRLQKLILLWLSLEKQRPDFTVIALEQKSFAYLGSLVVKLRIDRVDALASGQQIVIDYKTGVVNVKDWFSTPMKDMQLPLYLLSSQAQGALLAQVNVDPKFSGVVQEDIERFGEVKYTQAINSKNLADTEEAWKKIMMALADDIAAGRAHVSPQPGACDYCDLQAVCRIKERGVASC